MNIKKPPVVEIHHLSIAARCDCGHRWTFRFTNDWDWRVSNSPLMCPRCGAGIEVRAYGPLKVPGVIYEEEGAT